MSKRAGKGQVAAKTDQPGLLLGTAQAAEELGVSPSTLRRWLKEGRLQGRKVGKRWRFERSELGSVVDLNVQEPARAAAPPTQSVVERCDRQLDSLLLEGGLGQGKLAEAVADLDAQVDAYAKGSDPAARHLMAKLLLHAVRSAASDLHIEPMGQRAKVRQRIDGALAQVLELPNELAPSLSDELKRWTCLDLGVRRVPQDGRAVLSVEGREVDLRISTMPSLYGQTVALRILDRHVVLLDVAHLGFEPAALERYQRILRRPNGLILVAGPTGCGKTTTIYASLRALNTPDRKIMTAEDPVEYTFDGITQTPIDEASGLGFARAARTMLRQAPNVMFIGEVRDPEVAQLVVSASLTGHLVFTAIHASDALAASTRLIQMGVKPFLVSSAFQCALAQRLVRLNCPECSAPYVPKPEELDALGLKEDDRGRTFHRGRGCARCHQLGFRGRAAVYELLEFTRGVRDALTEGSVECLAEAARASGWRTLREVALDKLFRGETTIEEVLRETCFEDRARMV